jgi:hypothetical protein
MEPRSMIHPELLPTAAELPALQLALDSVELTPNETMLLLAAGPALADAADPMADLANAVASTAPSDAGGDTENPTPYSALMNTIAQANPEQTRAMVVFALQNPWVSEGIELPNGGLQISE